MRFIRTSVLLTAIALSASCGGDGDAAVTPPPISAPVATVSIASAPITIDVGASATLSAVTRDAAGNILTGRTITWASTSATIATVSGSGVVTAIAAGVTQVTATSQGISASVQVNVRALPWTLTGALVTGRTLATLTLLANGKALLVGGQTLGTLPLQTLATCELFDPATNTWSSTGSLATGRENHIAILLADGRVLVAGGTSINPSVRLSSVELYDPITGTWSAAQPMATARQIAAAVRLTDGRVLVAGGSGVGSDLNAIAATEIFSPTTGQWSTVNPMTNARSGHTAALLADGSVLVSGGGSGTFASPTLLAAAERFDPITGAWTTTGGVSTARGFHRTITLANGRVLMIGGSDFLSTVFGVSDLFNPANGTWTPTGALASARVSHSATLLSGGQVLVAGGGTSSPLASTELYNPTAGTWTPAGDMRVARSNHAAVTLANGKVLVAGGQGVGALTTAELFDPAVVLNASLRGASRP